MVDIRGVGETNGGLRLQVREKNKGGHDRLATFISKEMKINTSILAPRLNTTVSISGLEVLARERDFEEAIRAKLGPETSMRVEPLRTKADGMVYTLVRLGKQGAETQVLASWEYHQLLWRFRALRYL